MTMVLLADVQARLEITPDGGDGDAFLQRHIDALDARIKRYCGRQFELLEYTDVWYEPGDVWARDRPVVAGVVIADGVTLSAGDDGYRVNATTGEFWLTESGRHRNWYGTEKLQLTYDAGYATDDLPDDLRELFDRVCAEAWNKRGSGDAASSYGRSDIARETTADIGSVEYVVPSSSVQQSADFIAGFPLAVLDPHVRHAHWIPDETQTRFITTAAA